MIWSSQVTSLTTSPFVSNKKQFVCLNKRVLLLQMYTDSWLENAANGLMGRQVNTLLDVSSRISIMFCCFV